VAEHVEDDPTTTLLLAVVPRGSLGRAAVAVEDPVAKLAPDREDAAEETAVNEPLELEQAGQEKLVLHDAVLDAPLSGEV
jgi:hypothetical protein